MFPAKDCWQLRLTLRLKCQHEMPLWCHQILRFSVRQLFGLWVTSYRSLLLTVYHFRTWKWRHIRYSLASIHCWCKLLPAGEQNKLLKWQTRQEKYWLVTQRTGMIVILNTYCTSWWILTPAMTASRSAVYCADSVMLRIPLKAVLIV